MKPEPQHTTPSSIGVNIPRGGIWLITNSPDVTGRVGRLLAQGGWPVQQLNPGLLDETADWGGAADVPQVIVLDIGCDMERGRRLLLRLRDYRPEVPTVILATEFSREFAAKILNAGISYYFPYDFVESEFESVIQNLCKKTGSI